MLTQNRTHSLESERQSQIKIEIPVVDASCEPVVRRRAAETWCGSSDRLADLLCSSYENR
eukprot:scaffold5633_cov46-Attheya_sp.AAC.2